MFDSEQLTDKLAALKEDGISFISTQTLVDYLRPDSKNPSVNDKGVISDIETAEIILYNIGYIPTENGYVLKKGRESNR